MAVRKKSINLLPQEEFDISIVGRVLKWAMGSFRIIVIVTEMVVMGAFLSRFWLDARNSDLNDLIEVKSAQVSAQKEFEKEFRGIKQKLQIFNEMEKDSKISDILTKVASKTPDGVNLLSLSFQQSSAQVKGVAGSELDIAQFISNLDSDASFKEVALGQVNSSEDNSSLTIFTADIVY